MTKKKFIVIISVSREDTLYWLVPEADYLAEQEEVDLFEWVNRGDNENGSRYPAFYEWWEVVREMGDEGELANVFATIAY